MLKTFQPGDEEEVPLTRASALYRTIQTMDLNDADTEEIEQHSQHVDEF